MKAKQVFRAALSPDGYCTHRVKIMGKHGKKQSQQQQQKRIGRRDFSYYLEEGYGEERSLPVSSKEENNSDEEENDNEAQEEEEEEEENEGEKDNHAKKNQSKNDVPSKFWLYQQSVQVN